MAAALEKTRKQAQAAHAELSLAAQHDRDAAVTAQSAVTERIAGQQTQSATLMASLAAPAPRLAAPARQPGAPAGPVIPNPAPAPPGPAAPGPTGGHTSGHTPPGEVVVLTLPGGAVNDPAGAKTMPSRSSVLAGGRPGNLPA